MSVTIAVNGGCDAAIVARGNPIQGSEDHSNPSIQGVPGTLGFGVSRDPQTPGFSGSPKNSLPTPTSLPKFLLQPQLCNRHTLINTHTHTHTHGLHGRPTSRPHVRLPWPIDHGIYTQARAATTMARSTCSHGRADKRWVGWPKGSRDS